LNGRIAFLALNTFACGCDAEKKKVDKKETTQAATKGCGCTSCDKKSA